MPNVDTLMKETKETLAQRLASKSNGNHGSRLNPFKQDGINVITLGQEVALGLAAVEGPRSDGVAPLDRAKEGAYARAVDGYAENLLDPDHRSHKVIIVSTIAGIVSNFLKRRGKTYRAGIFKAN